MDGASFSPFSLEHVPFSALVVRDGKTVACNGAAADLLGLTEHAFRPRRFAFPAIRPAVSRKKTRFFPFTFGRAAR